MSAAELAQYSLDILCGTLGLVSNIFLICVIVKCKDLHFNAYYLAAALAVTDILNGIASIAGGAHYLRVVFRNETELLLAPWECLYTPPVHLFPIAYHAGSMMILLIACDRFLAVAAVKFYFGLGNRYTFCLISFCFLYTIGVWAYVTFDTMFVVPQDVRVRMDCWGISSESVHEYDYYSTTCFVTSSVLIMMAALIILKKRTTPKVHGRSNANSPQAISARRNAKAAKLLAWISVNTFCMWVLPVMLVAVIDKYGQDIEWLITYMPFLWVLQPLHGATNLLIYFRRGSQLREAFSERS